MKNLLRAGARLHFGQLHPHRVALDHLQLVFGAQIIQQHVEEEAVELRLGQGIRAFQLDRILCRQHEEWRRERAGVAAHGD